jgi:dihydrofolate synthase / folylpolyglutamate synthase
VSDLDDLLQELTTLHPKAIDPGLERTLALAEKCGKPHRNLPPSFHVAGTNGKGSTLAFCRSILRAAGYTSHVMTSPHLVKFNERLVIADHQISDADLINLLRFVKEKNANTPITFFEITTVAGFYAFANSKADYCLIETGMGGRLDSTNILENPLATAITMISWDHMNFLGNTLTKIAAEKAGILKSKSPCIVAPQTRESYQAGVMEVFLERAEELNAPLLRHGQEWSFDILSDRFVLHTQLKSGSSSRDFPRPNLLGDHQIANAATAILMLEAGLERQQKTLSLEAIEMGLTQAKWAGRLQPVYYPPYSDFFDIYIDGGHNKGCAEILKSVLQEWKIQNREQNIHLILGMLSTKNPTEFFDLLAPFLSSAQAIEIEGEPLSFQAADLAQKCQIKNGKTLETALQNLCTTKVAQAKPAQDRTAHKEKILITGSLYLMGQVLRTLGSGPIDFVKSMPET